MCSKIYFLDTLHKTFTPPDHEFTAKNHDIINNQNAALTSPNGDKENI